MGVGVGATMGSLGAEIAAGATATGGTGVWAGITASGSTIGQAIAAMPGAIWSAVTAAGSVVAAVGEAIWGAILGLLAFL